MTQQQINEMIQNSPIIQNAFSELTRSHWSAKQLAAYDAAEKIRLDHHSFVVEAKDEGFVEGKHEGKREIIKHMLAKHLDRYLISEVTGLSLSEIEGIQ